MNGFFINKIFNMKNFTYTVTQLNNHAKSLLENNFNNICVTGEISSFKYYSSGHAYFTLKDDKSEISCTWFNYKTNKNLSIGQHLTLYGNVSIYAQRGGYQLLVIDSFLKGLGNHWANFQMLKDKLLKEGLFEQSIKKTLPRFPKNIGVVSSLEGSVVSDITNIVSRRSPHISLIIADSQVQGETAVESLCNSIITLNERDVDVIILARGGGSYEELMVFNNETLVRTIYNSRVAIVSAIGHETDTTLSDLVADVRASTPSEAAELCTEDKNELMQNIDFYINSINKDLLLSIDNHSKNIAGIMTISLFKEKLAYIEQLKNTILRFYEIIHNQFLFYIKHELINVKIFQNKINSGNIKRLKERGFSILRKDNKIVNDLSSIKIMDMLTIELSNGLLGVKVKEIHENKKN